MENYKVLQIETWINEFNPEEINLDKIQEYLDFIQESVKNYDSSRYSERHHVMPRCIDKEHKYTEECVQINGADHFKVHLKLVDCFNGKLKSKMSFALIKMKDHVKDLITPEEYELARKYNSEALRGNQHAKGHVHTEEARKKMSEHHRDFDTEETKLKRSLALQGHVVSKETRLKIKQTLNGRPFPGKSYDWTGKKHSEETKRKMALSQLGEKNAMYGKHHSEESRKKMSKSRQGNQNAKGNIWITNGINNRVVRNRNDIPEGWHQGRTIPTRKKVG